MQTTFDEFVASLKGDGPNLSPAKLAAALGIELGQLATLAGVHRNTVSMAPNSQKLQDAMRDVVHVISAAHALSGDIERALFWFRNRPIGDFGHRTPMQVMKDRGAAAVISYLESVGAGATG
jgi:hypothetical protein